MRESIAGLGIASLFVCVGAQAAEPLDLPPRDAEILSVMPRVAVNVPSIDPPWIQRGALRADGTFEWPLPKTSNEVNRRQIELLRALDKLRPFKLVESELEGGSIADRIGPEVLPVPPREAK